MNYLLIEIFSYSIAIGALIGLWRWKQIDPTYLPFVILLCIGLINEALGTILINLIGNNAINSNIYILFEGWIIVWFFYNCGMLRRPRNIFPGMLIFLTLSWIIDNFLIGDLFHFNSYSRILFSFTFVILSIQQVNRLMSTAKPGLLKHPLFIISTGFIIFFTNKILVEIFWLYGLDASKSFRKEVYQIVSYINLFVNLLFAIALLWIPRKRESLLP